MLTGVLALALKLIFPFPDVGISELNPVMEVYSDMRLGLSEGFDRLIRINSLLPSFNCSFEIGQVCELFVLIQAVLLSKI
ncbi:Uncharacterised protein [Streptococcus suis]|nr:Uncharacterised protein [Streptococcus suis]